MLTIYLALQLSIYVGSFSLPHWYRYRQSINLIEGVLGVRPETFLWIVGGYILARFVTERIKYRFDVPSDGRFASIAVNLAAGWVLYALLDWFPPNGSYLGWQSVPLTVPQDAWNWSFTAAQTLIIIAMIAPLIGTLISMAGRIRL